MKVEPCRVCGAEATVHVVPFKSPAHYVYCLGFKKRIKRQDHAVTIEGASRSAAIRRWNSLMAAPAAQETEEKR